jgi:hypothetical protein
VKPQAKATTKQPAKAKAKPKPKPPEKAPTITLGQVWAAKTPDWLYRCALVTRYEVRPDGTVWSTLEQVLGPDGTVVEDFWRLPLDFRPTQQVTGNSRKLVLKDRTITGLQTWLIRAGLTTPETLRHNDLAQPGWPTARPGPRRPQAHHRPSVKGPEGTSAASLPLTDLGARQLLVRGGPTDERAGR